MPDRQGVAIAVMGAGSVRCMPPIIGALSSFFGERPLEVRFWDADEERLDLFDRFARHCFLFNKCSHRLISTTDPDEAVDGADRVVLTVGENCARKYLSNQGSLMGHGETEEVLIRRTVSQVTERIDVEAAVFSMIDVEPTRPDWMAVDWPEPTELQRRALPHQILRFLSGSDYPHAFLKEYQDFPLKRWLSGSS
jgi:hypothetical protein